MAETSLFWGGTVTGDHGPYTDDQFSDFIRDIFQRDRVTDGVLYGVGNQLAVTSTVGGIEINTGKALVDGKLYENTAALAISLVNPGSGLHYYLIALRKDFSAQTVRAVAIGPEDAAYGTLTQIDGTTWDIEIARVTVDSVGTKTITTTAKYIRTNYGIQIPLLTYVQSGLADNWDVAVPNGGSPVNNAVVDQVLVQIGFQAVEIGIGQNSTVLPYEVTFPVPFSSHPFVLCAPFAVSGLAVPVCGITAGELKAYLSVRRPYGESTASVATFQIWWLAIGR